MNDTNELAKLLFKKRKELEDFEKRFKKPHLEMASEEETQQFITRWTEPEPGKEVMTRDGNDDDDSVFYSDEVNAAICLNSSFVASQLEIKNVQKGQNTIENTDDDIIKMESLQKSQISESTSDEEMKSGSSKKPHSSESVSEEEKNF